MRIVTPPSLSEFGHATIALDEEMRCFERLGQELDSLNFESDKGLTRGKQLIVELAESRAQLQVRMSEMSRALELARERNETMENKIAVNSAKWQARQLEEEQLQGRYKKLGDSVHHLNTMIATLKRPPSENLTSHDQETLRQTLNQAVEPLSVLVEEAKNLVQDAREKNMKSLERNADTIRQTLQSARNRLKLMAAPETPFLN